MMTDNSKFIAEGREELERLMELGRPFPQTGWFLQRLISRFDPITLEQAAPRVVILGTDVPAALLYAFTDHPVYILGGSLQTAHCADGLVPRDADPVSRSSLGWLSNPWFSLAQQALVIVPAAGDNQKKLCALLEDGGCAVFALDVPPQADRPDGPDYYAGQLLRLRQALEAHTHRRLTRRRLERACRVTAAADAAQSRFVRAANHLRGTFPFALGMAVLQSRYFGAPLPDWTARLQALTQALEALPGPAGAQPPRPGVLLAGSPVVFPNFKLPHLLQSAGLDIAAGVGPLFAQTAQPTSGSVKSRLAQLAQVQLAAQSGGAFPQNHALAHAMERALEQSPAEGVVYVVLKGQLEFDFELPAMEALAEAHGVPLLRLETDYQYQDVEQLRIRLEAYAELLTQRRYSKECDRRATAS